MPTPIHKSSDLAPGDFYEDCAYHPCLCVRIDDDEVNGISLVNGQSPRACGIGFCGIRKLTFSEAMRWKYYGPADVDVPDELKWWKLSGPTFEWPYSEQ